MANFKKKLSTSCNINFCYFCKNKLMQTMAKAQIEKLLLKDFRIENIKPNTQKSQFLIITLIIQKSSKIKRKKKKAKVEKRKT